MKLRLSRNLPLGFLFFTICVVLIPHVLGINFYLYWRIAGYDRFVHILSSFWVTFTALALTCQSNGLKKKWIILIGLGISLIAGIAWELFEFYSGFTSYQDTGFTYDTIADIIADLVGGVIGTGFFLGKYHRVKTGHVINN